MKPVEACGGDARGAAKALILANICNRKFGN
jgi:hypothetical protein